MKWSLNEISKKGSIDFEEHLNLSDELRGRSTEILEISDILVVGQISYEDELYLLSYKLATNLTLPSSRSLKPVQYPLEILVNEVFALKSTLKSSDLLADDDFIIPLEKDLISLDESVADNILLEIPLQILGEEEEELPSGVFWSVLTEEDYEKIKSQKQEEKKSPFAKLDGLFD